MRCHHVFLGRNEQDDFSGLLKLEEAMKPAANKLQIFVPQEHNAAISKIQDQILTIRGTQVLLDRDLAELYGVPTKALNQAVKRNIQRFPDSFMFRLTKDDLANLRLQNMTSKHVTDFDDSVLRSQNVTSKRGGLRYCPYAFTEHGIVMRRDRGTKQAGQAQWRKVSRRLYVPSDCRRVE